MKLASGDVANVTDKEQVAGETNRVSFYFGQIEIYIQ